MVKHNQKICWQIVDKLFDHFVGLVLKGLMVINLRIKDVLKEVITRFKNTTNISRTSFNRDKSFQINVVYRI